MSILSAEYSLETHMRVYGEELLEDEKTRTAQELLRMGLSKEQVSLATKLSIEDVIKIESNT